MSKKRNANQTGAYAALPDVAPGSRLPPPLSPWLRWLLSGIVVLQLLAVFAEPFRFFTRSSRGTSPVADVPRRLLAPWVEFAYLNHGYFFLPEPGPSHLIECRFLLEDGRSASLRFPDREAQWPRLLYHRHFMMAENLHQLWAPPVEPQLAAELDPRLLRDWRADRGRYEMVRDSMMEHVANRYQAQAVELHRVEHRLPSDDEVFRQRLRLNDPRLYMTLPDTSMDVPPLDAPPGSPGQMPQPPLAHPIPRGNSPLSLPPPREEI